MKKIMLSGLISVAVMQAKLFVGIDGGYDLGYFKTVSHNSYLLGSTAFENTRDSNFYAGLNIGTQHFFGDYFGLRWFIGAGYIGSFKTAELNLGVDAILNFFNNNNFSFGIFAGVGSGFQLLVRPVSKGEIPIIGRVGLSFGIGEHNRIDITTQIPIITWSIEAFDKAFGEIYAPVRISLGYKFIF